MELMESGIGPLCEEIETGPGKRQRKVKVFDSYEDPHAKKRKTTTTTKKHHKTKGAEKKEKEKEKEKEAKAKAYKPREKKRIIFIQTPVDTKVLPSVALSHINKASQLSLSDDQMTCFGCQVRRHSCVCVHWSPRQHSSPSLCLCSTGRLSHDSCDAWSA